MVKYFKLYMILIIVILSIINTKYINSLEDPFFKDDTYIVVGDKVNVREEPKINSKIIIQLKITNLVRLIRRSGLKYKNRDIEGEWVYIDTRKSKDIMKGETYKGWIVDYYLAKGNQFEEVKEFYDCVLEGYVGDYHIYYEFKKDGSYKQKYYNLNDTNNIKKAKYKPGKLYKYRNVIILKDDFGIDYFYIDNNKLCYSEDNICTVIK